MFGALATRARLGKAGAVLGFVVIALLAYARVLDGWFLSDDTMLGMVTPDGRHVAWGHVFRVFHADWGERGAAAPLRYYRPLVILSQALDATLWGANPLGYHLTNVALHGINGFLLYRIARTLGASTATGLFAGALFVAFPWCPESVAWISGRTDVLSATGTLSSLLLYASARTVTGPSRARRLAGALAFYALGLLAKEAAFPLPLMVVAADLATDFDFSAPGRSLARKLPAWAAFGVVSLGYLWVRALSLGNVMGGDSTQFYRTREQWLTDFGKNWGQNLRLLLTPYNREAVGRHAPSYALVCALAGAALVAGFALAARARRLRFRLVLSGVAVSAASIAQFAAGIYVLNNLDNARYLYLPTAFFCLVVAALAAPAWERRASLVPPFAILCAACVLLMKNLTPWVEASDTMRDVTRTYAAAFGSYSGETIDGLPPKHDGALMALYNAAAMGEPFVIEPPKPAAVASLRAIFSRVDRQMRVVPDPVAQALERLRLDRDRAEWLLPIDGTALDDANLEQLVRVNSKDDVRTFRATSSASWLILAANRGHRLDRLPGADEYVYLLVRPKPENPPNVFWISRKREQFGAPRFVELRPELAVSNGQVVERQLDGYYVYAFPLNESKWWPGMERIRLLRLDPHFSNETFDIGFFGLSRYLPPE